jgi:hypothetical protein
MDVPTASVSIDEHVDRWILMQFPNIVKLLYQAAAAMSIPRALQISRKIPKAVCDS